MDNNYNPYSGQGYQRSAYPTYDQNYGTTASYSYQGYGQPQSYLDTDADCTLSVGIVLLQQYLRQERDKVCVVAILAVVSAEEKKEKRGIIGGYGLGYGGLDHGIGLSAPLSLGHASSLSLGHPAPLSLGHAGSLSLGHAAPLNLGYAAPLNLGSSLSYGHGLNLGYSAPLISSPIVTKTIAAPVITKTLAAPISYGHGLGLGVSSLGLGGLGGHGLGYSNYGVGLGHSSYGLGLGHSSYGLGLGQSSYGLGGLSGLGHGYAVAPSLSVGHGLSYGSHGW